MKILKYWTQVALAHPGTDPDTVCKCLVKVLSRPQQTIEESARFRRFLSERKIGYLVHFTTVSNAIQIARWGLMPRKYLELEPIRLKLRPLFTDHCRYDGRKDVNCLSVSFPNYKMFFKKRKSMGGHWAVLLIDPDVLTRYRCEFCATNNASLGALCRPGVEAAQRMFSGLSLRQRFQLPAHYTTDPQAEVLGHAVIPPACIRAIHVNVPSDKEALVKRLTGVKPFIKVVHDPGLFGPRRDFLYWKNATFAGGEDYHQVLAYEHAVPAAVSSDG
jgi:hypothetical protein